MAEAVHRIISILFSFSKWMHMAEDNVPKVYWTVHQYRMIWFMKSVTLPSAFDGLWRFYYGVHFWRVRCVECILFNVFYYSMELHVVHLVKFCRIFVTENVDLGKLIIVKTGSSPAICFLMWKYRFLCFSNHTYQYVVHKADISSTGFPKSTGVLRSEN